MFTDELNFILHELKLCCYRFKIKLLDWYVGSTHISSDLSGTSFPFIDQSWKSLSVMLIIL